MNMITFVIPAYNAGSTIRNALASIDEQFGCDASIVVIDDCSSDSTCEIVDEYSLGSDTTITLLRSNHRSGPGAARNLGISVVSSPYLGFLDADDIFHPMLARRVLPHLYSQSYDIIEFGFERFYESEVNSFRLKKVTAEFFIRRSNSCFDVKTAAVSVWYPSTRIYRTSLWSAISFPVGVFYEDPMTIPSVYAKAKSLVSLKGSYLGYIYRDGSITAKPKEEYVGHLNQYVSSICNRSLPWLVHALRVSRTSVNIALILNKEASLHCLPSWFTLMKAGFLSIPYLGFADLLFALSPSIYISCYRSYLVWKGGLRRRRR